MDPEEIRAKRRAAARRRAARKFTEWRDGLPAQQQETIAWLLVLGNVEDNGFLTSLHTRVAADKQLTAKQLAAADRTRLDVIRRAARRARTPVPTGEAVTVEGEVAYVGLRDYVVANRTVATILMMMVAGRGGWKVWVNVPPELVVYADVLQGSRVRFVADVALAARNPDPRFGFARHPRRGVLLGEGDADTALS